MEDNMDPGIIIGEIIAGVIVFLIIKRFFPDKNKEKVTLTKNSKITAPGIL